ncbi:Crp/Fnr family transcriptional regulator [Sphingomonas abietis]|uniref:Crp/Fnr family transcriptional regulator n=1 Tax=Sphingomonas abietis TaxID=3012344 RepID=A0ABY7NJA5_9SPHN|nr:Crp/Fnr family transcriptional regulator [Sphingomonas abietis]WBO20677.1 Crp/Fnr family transcriptional regulator [Sphingomonas abietis]
MRNEPINNRLLLSLPPETLQRLMPEMDLIQTESGAVIDHIDGLIEHLYFVNRGIVSLVKVMHDGRSVEVGAIGIEGVTDSNALFGVDVAITETMVQVPGSAFKIGRAFLSRELENDRALRRMMERYWRFAFGQLAQTAACNRLHTLEERCCRWLLTSHDSALDDSFPLTHEFLATMLGATRSSVSLTAKVLHRAGCIDYTRGIVTIADRLGLEETACECYSETATEMNRLFGPDTRPPH